jgi:hypothetical protein
MTQSAESGGGGMKFLPSRQPTRDVSPRPSGYPDKAGKNPRRVLDLASSERTQQL